MKTESPTICQVCGGTHTTPVGIKDEIALAKCTDCGTVRVPELDEQDYMAMYMGGWYQDTHIDTVVEKTNAERYQHDKEVALLRLAQLSKFKERGRLLDVGCSNGAFVDAANDAGYDAWGCDLCDDAFGQSEAAATGKLKVSELSDFGFQRRQLDVIVMNDVVEHMLDTRRQLLYANGLLKRDGLLVIDMPDFGFPLNLMGMDYHHVKPREHVWYPSPTAMQRVLEECDFVVLDMQRPVENKIVIYAQPNPDTVINLRVWGPTGLGDMHWVLLKLGALKQAEAPCKLRLTIPGYGNQHLTFRAAGFLKLVTMIDEIDTEVDEPVIVDEGSKDPAVPHYRIIANGHIERGHRIETWYPDLAADFHYEVQIPERATAWAEKMKEQGGDAGKVIILYASSDEWNENITAGKAWRPKEWMDLIDRLNNRGIYPYLIGKPWDTNFAQRINKGIRVDLIGKTNEAQMLALFKIADAVIGMCSGATILSPHVGAKSLVFWPERGKIGANMEFHKDFQTDWVDPEQLADRTYVPMSLGTFDVDDVMRQLEEWRAI